MTESQLRTELHKPYQLESWRNIIKEILPKTEFFITTSSQKLFESEKLVEKAFQFGTIELSKSEKVALIDVQLKEDKPVARNKVELRELASKALGGSFQGLLVLFHSPNQADYRLSFISKTSGFTEDGEYVTTQTSPKRYTYVLGENESCTTATSRLFGLTEKNVSLEDLTQAFNVEKLNNDFFKGYEEQYKKFWHYINGQLEYRNVLVDKEQTDIYKMEKPIRDFAKKLLGRIVFLYFLQKKGWLGVPANASNWKGGDSEFIKNLFKNTENKANFYSEYLVKLFFNTLNQERSNDIFELTSTKVPYLNGGLFDNDMPLTNHFNFPEHYFTSLLDFFGQYNFTIDENSPDDAEVGIDPEMLGHIFENLLEENQNKTGGIFYTPKAIVQYMCQESLIQYLLTHLETDNISFEELSSFIRYNERGNVKGFVIKNARKIEALLDKVKVCDPAIGSGAFPMGILHEIFKAKMTLDLTLDPAEVKRHIIQNSIYGVDLERGAVDIARLRFWLALVVDEEEPSPLPNLDYKIMQGNSLLESFEGKIPLDVQEQDTAHPVIVNNQFTIDGLLPTQQLGIGFSKSKKKRLLELQNEYYDANAGNKDRLKTEIEEIVAKHIENCIQEIQKRWTTEKNKIVTNLMLNRNAQKSANSDAKKRQYSSTISKLEKDLEKYERLLTEEREREKRLKISQKKTEKEYFLWRLYFKEVFENGGFDIVIGNPPYIQLQQNSGYLSKLFENEKFKTFERTGDIYSLFYEHGFNILKDNGVLSFITSNKWMRAGYGESLRNFFTQNTNPIKLIDFAGQKIFENATVDTNILIFKKSVNKNGIQACVIKEKWSDSLIGYIERNSIGCQFSSGESWVILTPIEQRIKSKIEQLGTPLKNWDIQINYGIKTGFNEAFIIDGKKKEELISADPKSVEIIRPILRGRDIKRYGCDFADLWLINTHNGVKEKCLEPINMDDYPIIKSHLDKYHNDLIKRTDKGDTFYNLRNCAYMDDFFKPKIVWIELADKGRFFFDKDENFLTLNGTYIMTGNDLEYLICILNNPITSWHFNTYCISSGVGTNQWRELYVKELFAPFLSKEKQVFFINSYRKIIHLKKMGETTLLIEQELNKMVYDLFELNQEEVQFIENQ